MGDWGSSFRAVPSSRVEHPSHTIICVRARISLHILIPIDLFADEWALDENGVLIFLLSTQYTHTHTDTHTPGSRLMHWPVSLYASGLFDWFQLPQVRFTKRSEGKMVYPACYVRWLHTMMMLRFHLDSQIDWANLAK